MPSLTLDWLHIITLLGAAQGVLLAGVLAARRSNRMANRLLAALVLALSVQLATAVYHAAGLVPRLPHLFGFGYPMPFLYGPLTYLYAVAADDRSHEFTRRDLLHFIPFAAVIVVGIPIYMMSGPEKIELFQRLQAGQRPLSIVIADPLRSVSGLTYAVVTILFLRRHRELVKENYSSLERVNLRWLAWLTGAEAVIWLLAVAFQVLGHTGIANVQAGDDYVALGVAIMIYGIGYMGLRQPEIFRHDTAEYPIPTSSAPIETPAEPEAAPTSPRYERSGLTTRQAERLELALKDLMDRERPWRDSNLTLADLADRLSTSPHKLSEVLNSRIGQTFYDFVNGYRVREVQRRIAAGDSQRLTMLTLAMEAGFASKSTFNLVFKKHTSLTPSDYRQTAGV